MNVLHGAALAAALFWPAVSLPQPAEWVVGVSVVDMVERAGMPEHLLEVKPKLVNNLNRQVRILFEATGRCRSRNADARVLRSTNDARAFDYVASVILRKLSKSYRNKEFMGVTRELRADDALVYSPKTREIRAEPILISRLEIELREVRSNRVRWSASRDSTATVPHGRFDYVINSSKYPDALDPVVQQHFMADILRLSNVPGSPVRYVLDAADRWYISRPREDVETAAGLLRDLVGAFFQDLDGHLPLEGKVMRLIAGDEGDDRIVVGVGTTHGVVANLKMDVWRPEKPGGKKVGQIKVIQADSTTAIASIRKIEKSVRKRGEGIRVGDRVISKKRRSRRRHVP